ncbi:MULTISPECIES: transglycosylase SLT domain-containing protein [unclassified Bradyrhizobium]|uniref:lytic transglycosylase domain-containing protein n=1 Tax=unclassified Bradyrhizobium TaxID=2631580 RepID=UPI00036B7FBB|nr:MULTISPECIES: transglycosylase SLT domain-containing protein [unclassified Bradyrhizobium]MCK1357183.1 transglycosylase SLT domain-containing protein [Bradyrhizobium sp. CW7]MCK1413219.1 transglycosylase SLT domain-containing protein [Bradyrhizobium sp. CW4]MCK1425766.1 transglycosylase SLT domain-containing protein [Bradyrhizobium sp. 87]MCK1577045.1 transglycosylase SLT domain-containing protein [Bradyrhizobium sp. 174]UPJ26851.1 transglycosylase SLT domain-containing protein [Bradyrhizob
MQESVTRAGCKAHQGSISLFVSSPRLIPLKHQSAVARGRQWRPQVGARSTLSTGTSSAACSRHGGDRAGFAVILLAGLLVMGGPTAAAQEAPIQRQQVSERYATHVAEAAQRFGIPVDWIRAVMRIESGGDRRAVSPKGALGLMQLMPKTWTEMRVRYGLGHDPFDPHDNIFAGTAFLRELHDRYGSPGFLAAYNAGPGRYEDYRDRHRPLPTESVAYVAAVVPFVDVESTPGALLVAASSRSSWTRAPLFFTRADGLSSATRAASDRPTTDKPAAVPVHDLSAIAPQSNGLFVALSTTGGSR